MDEKLLKKQQLEAKKAKLRLMMAMPLEDKIERSKRLIWEFYQHENGNVYHSFSGGKHSLVLRALINEVLHEKCGGLLNSTSQSNSLGNSIGRGMEAVASNDLCPSLYFDTGLEYDSVRKKAKETGAIMLRPKVTAVETFRDYGAPVISKRVSRAISDVQKNGEKTWSWRCFSGQEQGIYDYRKYRYLLDADFRISNACCKHMKHDLAHMYEKEARRSPLVSTLAEESLERRNAWYKTGCLSIQDGKASKATPISFWTEQDILQYLLHKQISLPECYGDIVQTSCGGSCNLATSGVSSTGCMYCMYGVHLEKGENRFQKMYQTHRKQWNYCMDALNLSHILGYMNVPIK